MRAIKHTFTRTNITLRAGDGRDFKVVHGEIYEVVHGEGFIAETKVVVREDVVFVARQLTLAVEI